MPNYIEQIDMQGHWVAGMSQVRFNLAANSVIPVYARWRHEWQLDELSYMSDWHATSLCGPEELGRSYTTWLLHWPKMYFSSLLDQCGLSPWVPALPQVCRWHRWLFCFAQWQLQDKVWCIDLTCHQGCSAHCFDWCDWQRLFVKRLAIGNKFRLQMKGPWAACLTRVQLLQDKFSFFELRMEIQLNFDTHYWRMQPRWDMQPSCSSWAEFYKQSDQIGCIDLCRKRQQGTTFKMRVAQHWRPETGRSSSRNMLKILGNLRGFFSVILCWKIHVLLASAFYIA